MKNPVAYHVRDANHAIKTERKYRRFLGQGCARHFETASSERKCDLATAAPRVLARFGLGRFLVNGGPP